MFGGCTWYGSQAGSQPPTYDDIKKAALAIHSHLGSVAVDDGILTKIPSFLIANNNDERLLNLLRLLLTEGSSAQLDWGRELFYLRQFGSNAFDRAGAETRAAMEQLKAEAAADGRAISNAVQLLELRYRHIPSYGNYDPPIFESSRLTGGLLEEWWEQINNPSFRFEGLVNFARMWVGAISMIRDNPASNRRLVEFDQIRDLLSNLGMPLWPEMWTTDVIERHMGIRRANPVGRA